jgi:hypothetical protein
MPFCFIAIYFLAMESALNLRKGKGGGEQSWGWHSTHSPTGNLFPSFSFPLFFFLPSFLFPSQWSFLWIYLLFMFFLRGASGPSFSLSHLSFLDGHICLLHFGTVRKVRNFLQKIIIFVRWYHTLLVVLGIVDSILSIYFSFFLLNLL